MTRRTLLPSIGCALLLAACASDPNTARKPAAASLDQVMAEAGSVLRAGQPEQALTMLKGAAGAFPADKAPWLQMAQIKFERGNYGEAIEHALEALQRDPQDRTASSIVAVSGLRLASKALADLARQNNLGGSLRVEAQELARLLRASLGEEVLVPAGARRPPPPPPRKAPPPAPARVSERGASGDPFGTLK